MGKYPDELEFPKHKDFQYAHTKLFELVEYVLKHSKDLTPEDEKFKKNWELWKQKGLASQQSLTMVKRRMSLPTKGCLINHYMTKMSTFPRLKQFVTMEYVPEPQPLMKITNKFSTKPTLKLKQLTMHRRSRSMSPRKPRSITPRKKTTTSMTPRKDGGVTQTPTVNNLSKQKVVESKVAVEGGVDETKTHVSSATDTDEFMSAQGSTTSESEPITLETQDSTSNVTDVSELSEGASRP